MLTKAEKLDSVKKKLNEASAKEGWGVQFATDNITNKLDSLLKQESKTTVCEILLIDIYRLSRRTCDWLAGELLPQMTEHANYLIASMKMV